MEPKIINVERLCTHLELMVAHQRAVNAVLNMFDHSCAAKPIKAGYVHFIESDPDPILHSHSVKMSIPGR